MTITIIVAHDPNLVIGNNGSLPWHYPEDLKHFKNTTIGHPIVMGRGVFEELNEKPLPGRRNIVLSTTKNYDNVDSYSSLEHALDDIDQEEVFIIGGGVLYRETIGRADKMIITLIREEFEGDTFFPEYRDDIGEVWQEVSRESHENMDFIVYERITEPQSH